MLFSVARRFTHLDVMAATDFFTAEVLTWKGPITYYVLFFIHLETRRICVSGITRHPDQEWMEQQARAVAGELLFAPEFTGISVFPVLLGFCDERSGRPFHPFHRYPSSPARAWRGRSIVAESILLKHQLLILNRSRQRAPICPRGTGSLPAG